MKIVESGVNPGFHTQYYPYIYAILFQAPSGMIFPDRATLYVTAIEDRQYKDEKINCKYKCDQKI